MLRLLLLVLVLACLRPVQAVKAPLSGGGAARGGGGIRTPWHLWRQDRQQTGVQGYAVVGQRIPRRYFVVTGARCRPADACFPGRLPRAVTQLLPSVCVRPCLHAGFGETDQGSGTDPFETGAHDLGAQASVALAGAG